MLGVSRATFWRWGQTVADFPIAFRLGPNAVGFDEAELKAWLEARRVVRSALDLRAAAVSDAGR
jgi:predicted DNA-binding transcriptional regulator AlpA